jgi:hypothetical protein
MQAHHQLFLFFRFMADSFPFKLEFPYLVIKIIEEALVMKKKIERAKKKKPKTVNSDLYDCCWYEPPCDHLCCGGICSC